MLRVFCSEFYSIVDFNYTNKDPLSRFLTLPLLTADLHSGISK